MTKQYCSLHQHDYMSFLDSPAKPDDIAKRAAELDIPSIAITNHGCIASHIMFHKSCKKQGLRPILGNELYTSKQSATLKDATNRKLSHLVVLAKNKQGWLDLVKLTSAANHKDNYYYKPRLSLEELSKYINNNIISINGHVGSSCANELFTDFGAAYSSKTLSEAASFLDPDWRDKVTKLALLHRDIFGKDNFFLEIQNLNQDQMPAQKIVADCLRQISKDTGIPCVASNDAHFVLREHKTDQQILLCTAFQTTLREVYDKLESDEDVGLAGFFNEDSIYHIPSYDEMRYNTEEELQNTHLVASLCEDYDVTGKPLLPQFDSGAISNFNYMKELCRKGWKTLGLDSKNTVYVDRVKEELAVFEQADLSGYFLIVADYINKAYDLGYITGPGRGSSGGSLVAYLLGITQVDPIKYDLLFSRFYNAGRAEKGSADSLPDIDTDFPSGSRRHIIEYLKQKYSRERVGQLCTFTSLKGRNALKDVLRVTSACDPAISNEITKFIPDEAAIADELQNMKDAGVLEPSIIMWALENKSKDLAPYCILDDKGNLQGEFSKEFAQAIRLEGCKRNYSRHASAYVISGEPLAQLAPMIYDKSNPDDPIIGFDMHSASALGLVKFDILGLSCLDKLIESNKL